MWEIREQYLQAGSSSSYIFTTPDLRIYGITITPEKSYGITSVRIERLKSISKTKGITPPAGIIYAYSNIWMGNNANVGGFREGIVKFKVEKDWISDNNIEDNSIVLLKWDGSNWIQLETDILLHDDQFVYYESETEAFSTFAISSIPVQPSPTPHVIEITETPALVEVPTKDETGAKSILIYVFLLLIILVIFLYLVSRKIGR